MSSVELSKSTRPPPAIYAPLEERGRHQVFIRKVGIPTVLRTTGIIGEKSCWHPFNEKNGSPTMSEKESTDKEQKQPTNK